VAATVAAQRALATPEGPNEVALRVRMALHTGEPRLSDGGYIGLDVHRAARLAAAGHGGQVLLSDATRALVEPSLPADVSLRDLGAHRLKDLRRPERIFQLVVAGLPGVFPPLRTLDARPNNLPLQATPLIGREREVAEISWLLLRGEVRLVTLAGPGGTGKTRLGLQVAADLTDQFEDGVYFIALAPISQPELVASAIAQTLGLQETGSR
jgi:hypothetical protein